MAEKRTVFEEMSDHLVEDFFFSYYVDAILEDSAELTENLSLSLRHALRTVEGTRLILSEVRQWEEAESQKLLEQALSRATSEEEAEQIRKNPPRMSDWSSRHLEIFIEQFDADVGSYGHQALCRRILSDMQAEKIHTSDPERRMQLSREQLDMEIRLDAEGVDWMPTSMRQRYELHGMIIAESQEVIDRLHDAGLRGTRTVGGESRNRYFLCRLSSLGYRGSGMGPEAFAEWLQEQLSACEEAGISTKGTIIGLTNIDWQTGERASISLRDGQVVASSDLPGADAAAVADGGGPVLAAVREEFEAEPCGIFVEIGQDGPVLP